MTLPNESFKIFFEMLVQNSPAPMVIFIGAAFEIGAASSSYRILGPTPDTNILRQVYATGLSEIAREQLWQTADSPELERFFDSTYTLIRDNLQRPYGVFQIALEVTDQVNARRRLARSEERNRLALEGGKMGTWSLRLPEREVLVDQKSRELHRILPGENFTATIGERLHPEDLPRIREALQAAADKGELYEIEYRVRRDDGGYAWIYTRGEPMRDEQGRCTQLAGVSYDITERKQTEIDLNQAKFEAEQANRSKSEFLANMSHEIRTPLSAILGFAELMRPNDLPASLKENYLNSIARNGKALTRIIDDILDLAKIEAGRIRTDRTEFSLRELLNEVLEIFWERAEKKGLFLRVEIDPTIPTRVLSDPSRLRQILLNVLGNAVKFTLKGGIRIRLEPVLKGANQFKILVIDTGIGIDAKAQQKLFAPFVQADTSTTRIFGGTGLGLALSKRLALALGGDLVIERSTPDEGSTFAITFTAEIIQEATPDSTTRTEASPTKTWSGRQFLVVDDSEDNLYIIQNLLGREGLCVDVAGSGVEALERCEAKSFDLILMDIQMPEMDGYELIRAVRGRGITTPILALTAHAMHEDRERTRLAGFDGHVTKPLELNSLFENLRRLLR